VSFLEQITPIVITWNEEPNIRRVFDQLTWARDIAVVDSGSTDGTLALLAGYPNVRLFTHAFCSHEEQWNHAIEATNVATPWILTLDADYVLSDALVKELFALAPPPGVSGYSASFIYRSLGRALRGSLYPPRVVLFRQGRGRFVQQGHTQRLCIEGGVSRLHNPIFHDDRKPQSRWLANQDSYAALEAQRIRSALPSDLDWADRVRRNSFVAPALVAAYCLLVKGCILDGRAGMYYTFQRVVAEALLAMRLWDMRIGKQ
jgi:glycosyltransferase involved in cell wall biosynthesis